VKEGQLEPVTTREIDGPVGVPCILEIVEAIVKDAYLAVCARLDKNASRLPLMSTITTRITFQVTHNSTLTGIGAS
jgi:hypothetical protein